MGGLTFLQTCYEIQTGDEFQKSHFGLWAEMIQVQMRQVASECYFDELRNSFGSISTFGSDFGPINKLMIDSFV
jgi:hypothetical protein